MLETILEKYKYIVFVSPHFDDAILSAGDLISKLSTIKNVVIINIFTKTYGKNTLSAKVNLKGCNETDAKKLYKKREQEDGEVAQELGIKTINLGFVEALWRKRKVGKIRQIISKYIPELESVYPTYRWHVKQNKIAPSDLILISKIAKKLSTVIPKNALVFCPIAEGSHVDHLVVREACLTLFPKAILWKDFPYKNSKAIDNSHYKKTHMKVAYKSQTRQKNELIKKYSSQFLSLFPSGIIPNQKEYYFINLNHNI